MGNFLSSCFQHRDQSITEDGDIIKFTLEELNAYTDTFSERKFFGLGGFGRVYRGIIKGRQERHINGQHIAVKFSRNIVEGERTEWMAEMEYLPKVRHQNIIKLIGYCETQERFYLVYPFMQNGTVLDKLSGLDWSKTLRIIKGVANTIQKLHGFTPALVHRDLKLHNILLDKNFIPKVADLGKVTPEEENINSSGSKTDDIYSFGEIILQLITKEKITYIEANCSVPWRIGDSAIRNYPTQKLLHVKLERTGCSEEAAKAITELGLECVKPQPQDRPTIAQVIDKLAYLS
ncbi:probable serine/threonine-protein kinase PBL28 [Hevea brasiliensis]|uniref:probable serine/threonine-protein kinase PBL28 n=1 Tax=Hevea brasiliensis TaxID=3981 RepID=UPI0025ECB583|nr:probable serine/threonine-protein kinase PBL28 [Hevea brasiliensis]